MLRAVVFRLLQSKADPLRFAKVRSASVRSVSLRIALVRSHKLVRSYI
jgi:hypothetical protein